MRCPYCGATVSLKMAYEIYNSQNAYKYSKLWVCDRYPECNSYVGADKKTKMPKGVLADPALRQLRKKVYIHMSELWRSGKSKKEVYDFVAIKLRVPRENLNIANFDTSQCIKTINILNGFLGWKG